MGMGLPASQRRLQGNLSDFHLRHRAVKGEDRIDDISAQKSGVAKAGWIEKEFPVEIVVILLH